MVTNSFGKRNFMQPMRRLSMHLWTPVFFILQGAGGGGRGDSIFPLVLNVFPSSSQQVLTGFPSSQSVPKYVPQVVPNSTWDLSYMVCPKFNSPVYKLKTWNSGVQICLYFATGGPKRWLYWGHAQCSKKIADGPINMAPLK
jgi:hypothetical protein